MIGDGRAWNRWPHYLRFKSAGKPPVKGGRWSIRRNPAKKAGERAWKAWTNGKASRFNRSFHTQAQAIAWASRVARVYANFSEPEAIQIIKVIRATEPTQ